MLKYLIELEFKLYESQRNYKNSYSIIYYLKKKCVELSLKIFLVVII